MKKTIATAALALTGLLAVPSKADAGLEVRVGFGHGFTSSRASCGCTAYSKRLFIGRDRCGRPIFRYVRLPHRCGQTDALRDHRPRDRMYLSRFGNRHHRDHRLMRFFGPRPPATSGSCSTGARHTRSDCDSGRCPR